MNCAKMSSSIPALAEAARSCRHRKSPSRGQALHRAIKRKWPDGSAKSSPRSRRREGWGAEGAGGAVLDRRSSSTPRLVERARPHRVTTPGQLVVTCIAPRKAESSDEKKIGDGPQRHPARRSQTQRGRSRSPAPPPMQARTRTRPKRITSFVGLVGAILASAVAFSPRQRRFRRPPRVGAAPAAVSPAPRRRRGSSHRAAGRLLRAFRRVGGRFLSGVAAERKRRAPWRRPTRTRYKRSSS